MERKLLHLPGTEKSLVFCLPMALCASSPVTRVSRSSLIKKRENEAPKEDAACTAFRRQDKTYLYPPQDTP